MNRLHPFTAVADALGRATTGVMIPLAAVAFLSEFVDAVETSWLFVLAPLGALAGFAYGVAYYHRFTYELTPETFDVASGVFSRQAREIPYRRIQNVDVRQGMVQRLLGLAVVELETAGGGDTEARLEYVSRAEADRIQREVRRLTAEAEAGTGTGTGIEAGGDEPAPSAATEPVTDADAVASAGRSATADASTDAADAASGGSQRVRTLLFELELRELLLYAATAIRPGTAVLPVFLLAFVTGDSSLLPGFVLELTAGAAIATIVVPWAVATAVLSAAFTITRYYGFRLGREGNDFVYERGLIERHSGSIPVEKVQSVTITDNPLQRAIGYAGLWVETAGYGPGDSSGSEPTVPFAAETRVYGFGERITELERPQFESLPKLARRRYLARYTVLAAIVVAIAYAAAQVSGLERWYVAAIAFAAAPPAAHLKWTNMGYYAGDDHLVVRRGFWKRRTTVIPYYRIQTLTTRRSLFQRRLGLASVVVDTASSRTFSWSAPTIENVALETARDLHEGSRDSLREALRVRARDDGGGLSAEIA